MHWDTEDRGPWYEHGEILEVEFVDEISPKLPWEITLNPEKADNPTVPDLVLDGSLADLKTQNTPFFKSQQKFGISPQFAVSFNVKDRVRYLELYPGIAIVFWVNWTTLAGFGKRVKPMNRVWLLKSEVLTRALKKAPIHTYLRRKVDPRPNARDSYIIDLQLFGTGIDVG